jgi:hypothetical protein
VIGHYRASGVNHNVPTAPAAVERMIEYYTAVRRRVFLRALVVNHSLHRRRGDGGEEARLGGR